MDRVLIYPSAIPQDLDLLNTNKNTMVSLGMLMQAIFGTSTYVDGLNCTPTAPASLSVNVEGGSIYSLEEIDATAYGSIAADTTDQIVKQGIIIGSTNFATPAPGTVGQSVVYLVQAAFQETDGGSTVLPYYNSSDPSSPYSGPANSGQPQNTVRQDICHLSLKTGVAATTGTQVTPAPDAGYVGLWAITVANGQSTVTSGNIVQLSTAPFISPKLTGMIAAIQAGSQNFAHDTSGVANTITIALNPAVAQLTDGMRVWVKVANNQTGATVINTNDLGNVSAVNQDGTALANGTLKGNGIYPFVYDANGTRWQLETVGSGTFLTSANNLSDVANAATALGNLGGAPLASPALTGTPTAPTATAGTNTTQIATTAFVANATTKNTYQATPADPTGTTSTTGVMMGLGGTLTPTRSGKVMIMISGDQQNSSGSDFGAVQLYYGTGTAPTNGAALTGTAISGKVNGATDSTHADPFCVQAIVSGLTLNTPIWFDLAVAAVIGGTTSAKNLSISAFEL